MDDLFESTYHEIIDRKPVSKINEIVSFLIQEGDSYSPTWHALGFIHCKLASFSQGTLRLHIWPAIERHNQEQTDKVHDHIFSLTSFVICGKIKNEIFSISDVSKEEASNQCYIVKYLPNGAELQATGSYYNKSLKSEVHIKYNEHYEVLSGDLHQSSVPDGTLVATLVATYGHGKSSPRMLGPIRGNEPISRSNIMYDTENWLKLLASIESEFDKLC